MGEGVHDRDRDEAPDEDALERSALADNSFRNLHGDRVNGRHDDDREEERGEVQKRHRPLGALGVGELDLDVVEALEPPRGARKAVERDRSEHDGEERGGAGTRLRTRPAPTTGGEEFAPSGRRISAAAEDGDARDEPKYTANPSPFSRHSLRPKIDIPVHVATL